MTTLPTYVLVTPARNEAQFIELTIKSVVAQTVRPLKWVIVSDGSTDGTDEIVKRYAAEHPWIDLVRMPERRERHFAGKVYAFNAGYEHVSYLPFDIVANVDADISFDAGYFSFLLDKLAQDPQLGVVGTPFKEASGYTYDYRYVNIAHVSGACQVFRRRCFEQIGGYRPIKGGGVDYVAVTTTRMVGWKTETFTGKVCLHHRTMGAGQHSGLMARFKQGVKDYSVGNHPVWEVFRVGRQMAGAPYVIGGLMLAAGYVASFLRGAPRTVSTDLIRFQRAEQLRRLKTFVVQRLPLLKSSDSHSAAGAQ